MTDTAGPAVHALDGLKSNEGSLRTPKTSERIARQLATYIIDNDLPEGTRLPPEKEMTETFGVGRTTLREALRLLETRGALTIRSGPRGGPVVRRPRPEDLREGLTLLLEFTGVSLGDVLQAREALEPTIARLAAARISDDEIEVLQRSIDAMRESPDDRDLFLQENRRFHTTIAKAAGNAVLRVFNDTLKSIADGAAVGVEYTPKHRLAVTDAHERVIEALVARDPDAAEETMRAHLSEAGQYWAKRYRDLFDRPVRWIH